jgi:hypothetical protein
MALRSKLALVTFAFGLSIVAHAATFDGSSRIMDVMLTHLDKARACLDSGDVKSAIAYTESVMMDREEKIFLDTSHAGSQDTAAIGAFKDAVQLWTSSLPNAISVAYVTNADQADVVVKFDPSVVSEGMNVAGNIRWTRSIAQESDGQVRARVKAVIQVRTTRPGGNQAMSFELMRHTCAHEIGHLLGMGDSYHVGDLMGPLDLRNPATKLSDEEISAMRSMREQAIHLRSSAIFGALAAKGR